jgi:tetratricopeptide (TPR) repeat protein
MKKLIICTFLVLLPLTEAFCDQEADIFNRANEYYSSKDYRKAIELYTELRERGIINAALYYNLGNTYYKLGQVGYAILNYEKALLLKPFDRDIRENLEFVRRSLKEKVLPLYGEGPRRFLRVSSSYVRPRFFAILELGFFSLLILFLFLYLFVPLRRSIFKRYIFLFLVLFVLFGTAHFSYFAYEKNHPKGIIVVEETNVLSAPIAESDLLFPVYEGTKIKLMESRGEWLRVVLEDGREGWILSQSTLFI